jgi:hypothetical protein
MHSLYLTTSDFRLYVFFAPQGEKYIQRHPAVGKKGFVNRAGTQYNGAGAFFWRPTVGQSLTADASWNIR